MMIFRLLPMLVLVSSVSCAPAARHGDFDSPNPAAKMYAIEQAVRQGDRGAVRHLVEQLDSDDPAVRLLAIGALERLTGETFGYLHYDPPEQRRAAIRRWEQAVRQGRLEPEAIEPQQTANASSD